MNVSRHLYPVLGIFTVLTAASLSATHAAAPPNSSQQVIVANTASNPVPTSAQGTTQIAGTVGLSAGTSVGLAPGTSVGVTSLPAVQIAPGQSVGVSGNVNIANDSNTPVPITDAGAAKRVPAQEALAFLTFADGSAYANVDNNGYTYNGYTIPSGYRFVIQYITAQANLPSGQHIVDGEAAGTPLNFIDHGLDTTNRERLDVGALVSLCYSSGSTILGQAERNSTSGSGTITFLANGYLEPTN